MPPDGKAKRSGRFIFPVNPYLSRSNSFNTIVNGAWVLEKKHVVRGPNIGYIFSCGTELVEREGPYTMFMMGEAMSVIGANIALTVAK